jgi:hypothetical protein
MSGFRHGERLSGRTWSRAGILSPSDVPLAKLARDILAGWKYFCAKRGMPTERVDPVFSGARKGRPVNASLGEVAAAYVAIERPARGTLRNMAIANGLSYYSLASKVHILRRDRVRTEGGA